MRNEKHGLKWNEEKGLSECDKVGDRIVWH